MSKAVISESKIISAMVNDGAVSRGHLCDMLNLSKATVTLIVNKLLKQGIIIEGQPIQEDRVGRKTTELSIRKDLGYFIGSDMEGLAVRACLVDSAGNIVSSGKRAIGPDWSNSNIIECWLDLIKSVVSNSNIDTKKIVGLGAGLPGIVERDRLSTRTYLPPGQWIDFDISNFQNELGVKVTAANNVACVSEYERKKGAACGVEDFISILIRYGIGAAIYSNGTASVGQKFTTGELGHMRVDMRGPVCICGQKGCLDVFASGRTWSAIEQSSQSSLTRNLKKRAKYLSVGLANMLKLFHPHLIIINGIYNDYENIVKPVIIESLSEELSGLKLPIPEVAFGDPVELKTSFGAAMQASEAFLENHLTEMLSK